MPSIKFTTRKLKSLSDKGEYYANNYEGLMLRVSKVGSKTFCYRYRFNGKYRRITIGRFGECSLKDAKEKLYELRAKVKTEKIDPQKEFNKRKKQPDPKTFTELAGEYKDKYLPTLRESTRTEYQRIIEVELLPFLGNTPIKEISKNQIISLLDNKAYQQKSPTMANRIRSRLSTMFSFAVKRGLADYNPVTATPTYKKGNTKRDRFYNEPEIQKLWNLFEDWPEPTQSVLKMLLICGQRKMETMKMKWSDINGNVWTIPTELAKNKQPHDVPLSEMALEVIEGLRPLTENSDYVFCSPKKDNQPIQWLTRARRTIQKHSDISDFRPHDLRRTVATYMAKLGIERTTLGKILNHKGLAGDGQVTAIYDRHSYMKEKRQAMERWSIYLQQIIKDEKDVKDIKSN